MTQFLMIPSWFVDFSIGMGFLYAVVCGLVAYFSLKIYSIIEEKEVKWFGLGFMFIGMSYVLRSLLAAVFFKDIGFGGVNITQLSFYSLWGVYMHMALFIMGLATIAYATFGVQSRRAYSLLVITNLIVFYFCSDKSLIFYVLSSLLLVYISGHYILEYNKRKNWKTVMVFTSFVFLLLTFIIFLIGNSYSDFVAASVVELCAYLLILASLLCTVRKKKK